MKRYLSYSPFFPALFVSFFLLLNFNGYAQKGKLRKGDYYYNLFQFNTAIKFYQKALKKKPANFHALSKMADIHRLIGDYEQAEKWYAEVVKDTQATPLQKFYYAQMLRGNEKYPEAKKYYLEYAKLAPNDKRGQRLADGIDYLPILKSDSLSYRISPFPQNSSVSEFSPAYYDTNAVVFPSARGSGIIDVWSNEPTLDLFVSEKNDTSYSEPKSLPGNVNQAYHEGPVAFDTTFNTMYFTRNNYIKKRKTKKGEEGIMKLKVFKSVKKEGKWIEIHELPFNSDEYSVGHPSLTKDGKFMYFASDMPNAFAVGGQDLYMVAITDSGYGEPVNLGSDVNTEGDEVFPFIHKDGTLYFTSDSYEGFGGYDLYYTVKKDGKWKKPVNMGYPINSSKDDFGIIFTKDKKDGMFSSNRPGGKGEDDIYMFDDRITITLLGKVVDKKTDDRIPGAKIKLENLTTGKIDSLVADKNGEFTFKLNVKNEYSVSSEKYGYFLLSPAKVSTQTVVSDTMKVTLYMQRIDVGEVIKLENIYYDFDKYNIRPDAAKELDRFVQFMGQYPGMVVELRSHTDSRGSDSYNMWLSAKRAESAVNYVVSKGIGKNRITFKGYGESMPVNQCVNNVVCTEEEHQMNRRTEFKVVKQPDQLKIKSSVPE